MIMLNKIKYYNRINQYGYESEFAEFNGIEFVKNGEYYVNHKHGVFHRYIYEFYHKITIPKGYHIHHIDHIKSNNNINNLTMLTRADHNALHKKGKIPWIKGKKHSQEAKKKISENHADFKGENNPSYKQRTSAMYQDIRNGIRVTEFMRKYKCGTTYFYNTKRELERVN